MRRHRAVPTGRLGRMMRFGAMASGIAGGVARGGAEALLKGQKPDLEQLLLSPENSARLADGLSHLRGAALKLGQMISMDAGVMVPPELAGLLARMRDGADPMPPAQLRAVLDRSWGAGWYGRFKRFDVRPFASASIGQVHRATLADGTDLAIKVQYPGVRKSIDSDIDNVAALLRLSGAVPKGLDLSPLLAEAKAQLHAEADYRAEAQNLSLYRKALAGDGRFALPEVYPDLSDDQVLAMSYVDSVPLDDLVDAPQALRDQVAHDLIELVVRELFVFGAMQTDPNLANYRYDPDAGRIVLLDFGAVQSIAPELSQDFHALARAALSNEPADIHAAMAQVGYFGPDTPMDMQAVIRAMFVTAMEPLRQSQPFDFGASDLLNRLRHMGLAIGTDAELTHVPPAATLFLHRKIGGTYLTAARLRARVALRPLVERYL